MAGVSQGMTAQAFPQGVNLEFVPFAILDFGVVFRIRRAVRQCVILIGFLRVGVGTDLVGTEGGGGNDGSETIGRHPRIQDIGVLHIYGKSQNSKHRCVIIQSQ